MYRVLDLFAGAGGFSKGLHDAGFDPGVMIDFYPKAVQTLKLNYSPDQAVILEKDLTKFTPKDLIYVLKEQKHYDSFDLIVGGPPCQGWSVIGRGKLRSLGLKMEDLFDDPRNRMYLNYIKFVEYFRPKVFVMENVPGMLRYNGVNVADKVSAFFSKKGYKLSISKLNASDFGVPQNRERLFFVGVREDLGLSFQSPSSVRLDRVSVHEAISDLPIIRDGAREWVREYKAKNELSAYASKMRKNCDPDIITDHVCKKHRPQDIAAFKFLKPGQLYSDLPSSLKRYRDDIFKDKYRKLSYESISGCVTAHLSKDQYSHIHPTQARTISVREAARLQSFPDSYKFAGGMGDRYKQIGNAVAPLVAEAIGREIQKQIFSHKINCKVC